MVARAEKFVYVAEGYKKNLVKIGVTTDPKKRLKALRQSGIYSFVKTWEHFEIERPERYQGWRPVSGGGWTCYVEQGHYGHMSRKPTWLFADCIAKRDLPDLDWSKGAQRLHPIALERYGYEKARRIGMTAMVGGKDKTKIRNATPVGFRDVLIGIAKMVEPQFVPEATA